MVPRIGARLTPPGRAFRFSRCFNTESRWARRGGRALSDPPTIDSLLTVPEVAALLRLTRKGVYALIEARRIPFIRVSNRVRFCQSDVIRWLQENRVPASEK